MHADPFVAAADKLLAPHNNRAVMCSETV